MKAPFILYVACVAFLVTIQTARAGQLFSGKNRAEGDALYKSAFAAYDTGDLAKSQDLLNQAEKLKPNQADGWNLRGAVFLKQGIYDKAEAAFSRAVSLDPDLWAAQFNYSEVAFRSKNYPLARTRFDGLAAQTNRFKEKNQWELAQYKAFLSSLLMNDDAGAQKRLSKLPPTGGVTPAYAYAQAALAYKHRDQESAQKSLAAAQSGYSPGLNSLFGSSLETAGWQAPSMPTGTALAATGPLSGGTAGSNLPARPAYVIDPKLEAAAAEPLPVPDSSAGLFSVKPARVSEVSASPSDALLSQPSASVKPVALPTPSVDSALERGTLLD